MEALAIKADEFVGEEAIGQKIEDHNATEESLIVLETTLSKKKQKKLKKQQKFLEQKAERRWV